MPSAPGLKSDWWTILEHLLFTSINPLRTVHIYLYSQSLSLCMLPVSSPRFGSEETLQKRVSCNLSFLSFFFCLGGLPCTIHCYLAIFFIRSVMACISSREVHDSSSHPAFFFSSLSIILVLVVFMKGYAPRRPDLSLGSGV